MADQDGARMSTNQRRAHRFQVPAEHKQASLLVGESRFPARLSDMSAGGFGADVEQEVPIYVGEECVLETVDGDYHVCVKHIRKAGDRKQLGLSWHESPTDAEPWGETGNRRPLAFLRNRPVECCMGLSAMLLVAAILAAIAWSGSRAPSVWAGGYARLGTHHGHATSGLTDDSATPGRDRTRGEDLLVFRIKGKLRGDVLEQYTRLSSMAAPQAVRDLRLTPSQKASINRILDRTTQDLAALYEDSVEAASVEWTNGSSELIARAIDEAYGELTAPQRRRVGDQRP